MSSTPEQYRELADLAMAKAYEWGKSGNYNEASELRMLAETYMKWARYDEENAWIVEEDDEDDLEEAKNV